MEQPKQGIDLYNKSEVSLGTTCVSGHRLPTWADVKTCDEECPIFNMCKAQNIGEPCVVQKTYLGTIVKSAVKTLRKPVSDEILQRIGLIMLPLYNDLFLFQILKSSLLSVMIGSGVNIKPHPVFKLIKDQIALIDKQWLLVSSSKSSFKKVNVVDDFLEGDTDYYDKISK